MPLKPTPETPSSVPKENQPPEAPVAQCPKDQQLAISSETVETDLPDRARTRIGIGERVKLTATPGSAQWNVARGLGSLSSNSGATVHFTAADEAGDVEITAEGNGCRESITFTVVAPTGVLMERRAGTRKHHTRGTPSTGMVMDVWIQPADVSFKDVEFREREAYAVGTGWFEQYFRQHQVGHNPNPAFWSVERVDPGKGSKLNGGDRASARATSVGAGTISWAIPWEYQLRGALFSHQFPHPVDQVATSTANGTVTLTKGGESVSSNLNDSTEKDPLFP